MDLRTWPGGTISFSIELSVWMFQGICLFLTNQSALFQGSVPARQSVCDISSMKCIKFIGHN